jgi:dolichyl-phosphate beta-glucosyltransferase
VTLSIIIPAFEEERKIARDVETAARFLVAHDLSGEIIVVDDGSADFTAEVARNSSVPSSVHKKVIVGTRNRGKGFAVHTGILASQGEYVMFADSGVTVPFENALRGLHLLQEGQCDLAHGSRRLPESVIRRGQDWDRKLISWLFHRLVSRVMHLPARLTDTQCGFKLYRGESARSLYAECITDGFMFDIEVIIRAQKNGFRILEFPVEWTCDRDSRISVTRSSRSVIGELALLHRVFFKRS